MTVFYSLVLMFTINGIEHSVYSKHLMTKTECSTASSLLTSVLVKNPPFRVDENYKEIVLIGTNPYYICVPTSPLGNWNYSTYKIHKSKILLWEEFHQSHHPKPDGIVFTLLVDNIKK